MYNHSMNKFRLIYSTLAILFGAFIFAYGEYDDSPGAQLIGLLIAVAGVVGVIKGIKKSSTLGSGLTKVV